MNKTYYRNTSNYNSNTGLTKTVDTSHIKKDNSYNIFKPSSIPKTSKMTTVTTKVSSKNTNKPINDSNKIEIAKSECEQLGLEIGSEKYADCVLQLSK